MRLLCQGQSGTWNVDRKAQLFPSKPGSCANNVFGTSRIAFNHISPRIETRCDARHRTGISTAIRPDTARQTAGPEATVSGRTRRKEQYTNVAGVRSESPPGTASTDDSHAEGTDGRYIRMPAIWRPRCRRILHLRLRPNPARLPNQSRRPVALRPHLSVGLPKNRGQYA
jgi:hypothetical protein